MAEHEPSMHNAILSALQRSAMQDARFDHEKGGVFFYRATREGRDVVIKVAPSTKVGVDRIKNQALANAFLHGAVREKGIEVPATVFEEHDGFSLAIMDAVPGAVIAESRADGMKEVMTSDDIALLVSWLAAVRHVSVTDIPGYFSDVAERDWNETFYRIRLTENSKGPIEQGTLTSVEFIELESIWSKHYGRLSFQHHDVVPFNMIRKPDGRIALIDGEFARIGMAGYDAAYFAIQTYCLYGRADLAVAMLEQSTKVWESEFPEDDFSHAIMVPLAYRIIANLNDTTARTNDSVRERTVRLKDLILEGNVATIIAGLS